RLAQLQRAVGVAAQKNALDRNLGRTVLANDLAQRREDAAQAIAVLAARANAAPLDGRRAVPDDVDNAEARNLRARIDAENSDGTDDTGKRRCCKRGRRPCAHEHTSANAADRLSGMSHQCSAADHARPATSCRKLLTPRWPPKPPAANDTGRPRASVSG